MLIAEKFESAELNSRRLVCYDKFYSLDELADIIEKVSRLPHSTQRALLIGVPPPQIAARKVVLRTKLPCGKENSAGDKVRGRTESRAAFVADGGAFSPSSSSSSASAILQRPSRARRRRALRSL